MSVKAEIAAEIRADADRLERRAESWPSRQRYEQCRAAMGEAAAILRDAADQLLAPARERVRA